MIPVILAWLVVLVAFPLNLAATVVLIRLTLTHRDSRVLRERAYVAIALLMIVGVFAAVFLNNGMEFPVLNDEATRLVTRTAVLALALPAAYWLWLYRNGRRGG